MHGARFHGMLAAALVVLSPACGDSSPSQEPAAAPTVAAPRPARSRAAPLAEAPATLVALDTAPWRAPPEDLAFAARFGGPDDREAAWDEFQDLDPERQVRIVRIGLRLADPAAARTAAWLADGKWLDVAEQRRAAQLLVESSLDRDFVLPDGEHPGIENLFELGGAPELALLLARLAEDPAAAELCGDWFAGPHKLLGPEHLALLARIAALSPQAPEPWETAVVAITWNDAERDAVAAIAQVRLAAQGGPTAVPPPSADPIGAAAVVLGSYSGLAAESDDGGRAKFWAWRLLLATPGSAAAGRAETLYEIASDLAGGPTPWGDAIGRLADALPEPEATQLLRRLEDLEDGPPGDFTLAALAKRGDAEARERLFHHVTSALDSAVGAAFWAFPQETLALVSSVVLGNDAEAAESMLRAVAAADDFLPLDLWDRSLLESIPARAVEAELPADRLVLLARHLRCARTPAVGRAILDRPQDARFWNDLDEDSAAFLEAVNEDLLRKRLRDAWTSGDAPAAWRLLLALGDPASGPRLAAHLGDFEAVSREAVLPTWLARSDCREVRAWFAELADSGEARAPWLAADGVAGLAVCGGLPEDAAWSLREALADEGASPELLAAARRAVEAGRPGDAVAAVLAARPDEPFPDLHLAGDRPEFRAYLDRLRTRRELGLYAWATAELGLLGDGAARRETRAALVEHRYRWFQSLTWRQIAGGDPFAAAPRWIEALGTNCCFECDVVASFFEPAFGWEPSYGGGGVLLPVDEARRWWSESGGAFAWSRIAGHHVPRPR